jgi:hypothetical protein
MWPQRLQNKIKQTEVRKQVRDDKMNEPEDEINEKELKRRRINSIDDDIMKYECIMTMISEKAQLDDNAIETFYSVFLAGRNKTRARIVSPLNASIISKREISYLNSVVSNSIKKHGHLVTNIQSYINLSDRYSLLDNGEKNTGNNNQKTPIYDLNKLYDGVDVVMYVLNKGSKHWTLLCYFTRMKEFFLYDSMSYGDLSDIKDLIDKLCEIGVIEEGIPLYRPTFIPKQPGVWQCGYYLLSFIKLVLECNGPISKTKVFELSRREGEAIENKDEVSQRNTWYPIDFNSEFYRILFKIINALLAGSNKARRMERDSEERS